MTIEAHTKYEGKVRSDELPQAIYTAKPTFGIGRFNLANKWTISETWGDRSDINREPGAGIEVFSLKVAQVTAPNKEGALQMYERKVKPDELPQVICTAKPALGIGPFNLGNKWTIRETWRDRSDINREPGADILKVAQVTAPNKQRALQIYRDHMNAQ